jgi:hypothetical protein
MVVDSFFRGDILTTMFKKKTIPCDRCGARFDHIPEKCPACGEIIRDRMDPHIREEIEQRLEPVSPFLSAFLMVPFIALDLLALGIFIFLNSDYSRQVPTEIWYNIFAVVMVGTFLDCVLSYIIVLVNRKKVTKRFLTFFLLWISFHFLISGLEFVYGLLKALEGLGSC